MKKLLLWLGLTTCVLGEPMEWWRLSGFQSGILAGRFKFQEVNPQASGSLLFFISPTPEPKRMERLYVLNPRTGEAPEELLKSDRPIRIESRLDERTVLFSASAPYGLYLLDLATARWRPLLDLPKLSVVKSSPNGVYFTSLQKAGDIGYRIGKAGEVKSEPEPELSLFYMDPTLSAAVRVFDRPIGKIILETDKAFLVTTTRPQRELWWAAKNRVSHRLLLPVPEDWLADAMTATLSPDGSLLALSVCHSNGFFGRRDLLVLDADNGQLKRKVAEIPVKVSVVSSLSPTLNTFWPDNQHLRWSESELTEEVDPRFALGNIVQEGYFVWRDLDLATGEISSPDRYAPLGLRHSQPSLVKQRPDPTRITKGLVEIVDYQVFSPGSNKAVPGLNAYRLSPEGDFGIISSPQKGLWLWDARQKREVRVFPEWSYDTGWNETRL